LVGQLAELPIRTANPIQMQPEPDGHSDASPVLGVSFGARRAPLITQNGSARTETETERIMGTQLQAMLDLVSRQLDLLRNGNRKDDPSGPQDGSGGLK
jgi:hypothetical protein